MTQMTAPLVAAMPCASYGPNYDRLGALKTHFDPDNLFHENLNILSRV